MKKYDEALITAFMTSGKRSEIMKRTGISKSKYYRLREDAEFMRAVTERRNEILQDVTLKIEGYLLRDTEILQEMIEDPTTPSQTRMYGLKLMSEQYGQYRALTDLTLRLQRIEDIIGHNETF